VYAGQSTAGLRDVVDHPVRTARAEVGLRGLARRVAGRTLLLSRNASSFSTGRLEAALLSRAAHGVYDLDDALMNLTRGPFPKEAIWRRAAQAADVVVAGNDYLAEATRALNPHVVVIPSCVEVDAYDLKDDYEIHATPTAVWMGSPSTEFYLAGIERALLAEHERSGLRLRVISKGERSLGPLDAMVDREDWNLATFGRRLASADLGLMPLVDDEWSQGKCAYKLLQYGAAGLPSIASPVGANALALTRLGGIPARTDAEWSDALALLVDATPSSRQSAGSQARRAVDEHYSFRAWAPVWRATVLGEQAPAAPGVTPTALD
jgi:glycosyltransferase involved in cell wall biosynthesis